MTKFKATCKTCKKVFDKNCAGVPFDSQTSADAALRMHIGRVHSKSIPTYQNAPERLRQPALVLAGNGQQAAPQAPMLVTDRRTRAWREQQAQLSEPRPVRKAKRQDDEQVCYCPRCGLNIAIAKTALTVALRHS